VSRRPVPAERIRALNAAPLRPERAVVLHWMTSARRTRSNPALERAAELGRALGRPVLVLEPLRCGYPHASDRLHAFLLEGMRDNAAALAGRALYHPWVERRAGEGDGLLEALAARACAVVADDFPTGFPAEAIRAAAARLDVRLEAVDASCVVPFRLELGRGHRLVPRPLRPALGAGAAGVRDGAVHVLGEHRPEVAGAQVPRAPRTVNAARPPPDGSGSGRSRGGRMLGCSQSTTAPCS
jgi:hypothetical protein